MLKIKAICLFIIINIVIIDPFVVRAQEVRPIVFPIQTGYDYNFSDTYGAARSGGRTHEGTDIITAKMTPVVAVVNGRVTEVVDHDEGWGLAIYIQDADGYSYRYLHINNDTPGTDDNTSIRAYAFPENIQRGSTVTAGQVIAWAGDSGNAENVGSHLHFEIWTPDRQSINSYPSLMAAIGKPAAENIVVSSYQFTKDLELGDQDVSVKELQKYLNKNGFIVATTGAGSLGKETEYFGLATRAALIKFQQAKNISPAVGYFGPKTRNLINADNTTANVVDDSNLGIDSNNSNGLVTAGWLVKDKSLARVYYVAANLELQWIVSEEVAVKKFGVNWYLDIKTFDDLGALGLSFGDHIF
ncbi:MAG: peptidoglycan DD-metalloendopeptidase family protein [Patescibacteria group bacterium]|jgi:hypothetical protein